MKPLVYIAGPYTNPDPVENTHKAVKLAHALYDEGLCAVLIPHVMLLAHVIDPRPIDFWYRFDLDQLGHCDAVWRIPGPSSGADAEVAYATELYIPVFHDRDELVAWLTDGVVQ